MFHINFMTANQLPGTIFKGSLMLQFCSFFFSSAEKDVILAALFSQLLDSRKSWKLNNLETSFFSIYIGASQKIRIW